MRHYHAKNCEFVAFSGFSDLYIVQTADMTAFSTTAVTLSNLQIGDVVDTVIQETRTAVVGPTGTPTASVGVTGAVTQFTAATSAIAVGVVAPLSSVAPYVAAAAIALIANLAAGGGNGAAATAGEIWVWARISRQADRNIVA